MRLKDMGTGASPKKTNKILETRFGFKIDYRNLTLGKAHKLLRKVNEGLTKIRMSHGIHTAERNPKYMELLTMNEALTSWVKQRIRLTEGEMGQAEVILAAKSMVDEVQNMIEKIGKLQNEQLPPLLDTIRDQLGTEKADSFKQQAEQALSGLSDQLNAARQGLDAGARGLAGEETAGDMAMPGAEAGAMPGAEAGAMPGAEAGAMPGAEAGEQPDSFAATDAAAGGTEPMGREKR